MPCAMRTPSRRNIASAKTDNAFFLKKSFSLSRSLPFCFLICFSTCPFSGNSTQTHPVHQRRSRTLGKCQRQESICFQVFDLVCAQGTVRATTRHCSALHPELSLLAYSRLASSRKRNVFRSCSMPNSKLKRLQRS